ncbi:MAG TPA: DUF4915 domain-containing protein [Gemmataceae bacterium]|nr:DUF4915 domain-containing protein [Gemmataceae bacterium]
MKFLVSICNKNRAEGARLPGVFLFEVDPENPRPRPVPLEHPRLLPAKGITGLAHYGDGILAVMQGAAQLALLTRKYEVKAVWNLPLLKHAHSIAVAGRKAYIASTGNDSVVEFDPAEGSRVYWRHNRGEEDTIHLNSLVYRDGALYATAFGPKKGLLWSSASGGYLANLDSGHTVISPLYHPHSACALNGEFYFCESSRMAVGRENGQRLAVGLGYTRGLVVTEARLYVGISKGRTESVSTGQKVSNTAVPRLKASRCAVLIYRHNKSDLGKSELLGQVCLEEYGEEIYDILPV